MDGHCVRGHTLHVVQFSKCEVIFARCSDIQPVCAGWRHRRIPFQNGYGPNVVPPSKQLLRRDLRYAEGILRE